MAIEINGKVYRNLQEQVGKNQEDIELLKQRPAMHTEVVEELPEVGEQGIIYLVAKEDASESDIYNEYVWTGEAFEFIGNTSADISNMVTTDTDQEISGQKTFKNTVKMQDNGATHYWTIVPGNYTLDFAYDNTRKFNVSSTQIATDVNIVPTTNNSKDLGSSTYAWKDLYLGGKIQYINPTAGKGWKIEYDQYNQPNLFASNDGGSTWQKVISWEPYNLKTYTIKPVADNGYNIGSSDLKFKDLYLSGTVKIKSTDTSDTAGINLTNSNGNTWHINTNRYGALRIGYGSTESSQSQVVGITGNKIECGNCDIKTSGSLTDGTNSITVADIATAITAPTLTASASRTVVTINVPRNILPDYIELSVKLSGSPTTVKIYKTMSSSGISYGVSTNCHVNAVLGDAASTYIELDFDQDQSAKNPSVTGFTYSHVKDLAITINE